MGPDLGRMLECWILGLYWGHKSLEGLWGVEGEAARRQCGNRRAG